MGSNESFPPPPPPGQPPQSGNWPPQSTGAQPTQQVPATQMYPQQGYVPEATPPKKGNGLLIGGGLVVVAALVGGVVLLTGGDDDKKTSITIAPITSTTIVTATTIGAQITVPATVAPTTPATVAPTTAVDDGLTTVTDDTGTFSILVPGDLELDTTTITSTDGFIVPSISAADLIASYNGDDVTFGLTAIAVGPEIGSDLAQVMAFLEPTEGTCTGRSVEIGRPTSYGAANQVSLSGCGAGGGNKVLIVVQVPDRPFVIGIYLQGLASIEALQPVAQYALESIVVF